MLRKLLVAALLAIAAVGSGVSALADHGEPQKNEHGMCTAYFNGSENGQENKRKTGPFQAFESWVGENDHVDNNGNNEVDEEGEDADAVDVWNYCNQTAKGIGGTPDDPND